MTARIWQGFSRATDIESYTEYLNRFFIPGYQAAEGHQGELTYFLLLAFLASGKSSEKFTGIANHVVNPVPEERPACIFDSTARPYQIIGIKRKNPINFNVR